MGALVARPKGRQQGDWRDRAACIRDEVPASTRVATFYPEKCHANADRAKAICATCVVRTSCLQEALERKETKGIWGGLDYRERKVLLTSGWAPEYLESTVVNSHGRVVEDPWT